MNFPLNAGYCVVTQKFRSTIFVTNNWKLLCTVTNKFFDAFFCLSQFLYFSIKKLCYHPKISPRHDRDCSNIDEWNQKFIQSGLTQTSLLLFFSCCIERLGSLPSVRPFSGMIYSGEICREREREFNSVGLKFISVPEESW